jgi:hypothetical protein
MQLYNYYIDAVMYGQALLVQDVGLLHLCMIDSTYCCFHKCSRFHFSTALEKNSKA